MKRTRNDDDDDCKGCATKSLGLPTFEPESNFERAQNFDDDEKTTCETIVVQNQLEQAFYFETPLRNVRDLKIEMVNCTDFATAASVVVLFCNEIGTFQRNIQSGLNFPGTTRILRRPIIWTQPSSTLTTAVQFVSQLPSTYQHFTVVKEFSTLTFRLDTLPATLGVPGPAFQITWRITTKHVNIG